MSSDLMKAIKALEAGGCTCVVCKGNSMFTSAERGVRPLMGWLDGGDDLSGFSAADKVIGRAAAFLYVLLGVKEVYAPVMSEGAVYLLARHGILPVCGLAVKEIINRAGTDICPMEQAVAEISEPRAALEAIRNRADQLAAVAMNQRKSCAG